MALRSCKHCYKTIEDEEHSWFCPFGSGVSPAGTKKSQRGADNGGGGGGEPGERNTPPLPDAPGGGGAAIEFKENASRGLDLGKTLESKPAMIENQPALALPPPSAEVKDGERVVRDHRLGKR